MCTQERWGIISEARTYEISSDGRLRNRKTGRILKPRRKRAYIQYAMTTPGGVIHRSAHRLVALAFLEPCPECPAINHKDSNGVNNCVENLEWVTHKGNVAHCILNGRRQTGDAHWTRRTPERCARGDANGSRTHPERLPHGGNHWTRKFPVRVPRGTLNPRAKLTDNDVREIRRRRANGEFTTTLAAEFGVTDPIIGLIAKRKLWAHVQD